MAFTLANLARVSASANTKAPTHWSYASTAEAKAVINAANYFLPAYLKLSVGDVIFTRASDGFNFLTVTTCTSTGVTVAALV